MAAGDAGAQSEVSPFCATVYKAAASAVANRAAGQTAEQLRAALPSRESLGGDSPDVAIARVLHEIIDDVFSDAPLEQTAYAVYRTEVCIREEARLPVPESFAAVRAQVMACGRQEGDAVIDCAVAVASPED
ncbi:MAG: hypothetical protein AAF184_21460 [Pseudomonadota bacterium]